MQDINKIVDTFKVLGDVTRLKIIATLQLRDCCVCELVPLFGISQPAVSKHVSRLKSVGLIQETRKGQWVVYSLNSDAFNAIGSMLSDLPDFSSELKRLDEQGLLVDC